MAKRVPQKVRPSGLITFTTKIHPEARRAIRVRAAQEERPVEEILRSLLYPALGLKDLPIVTEPTSAS